MCSTLGTLILRAKSPFAILGDGGNFAGSLAFWECKYLERV